MRRRRRGLSDTHPQTHTHTHMHTADDGDSDSLDEQTHLINHSGENSATNSQNQDADSYRYIQDPGYGTPMSPSS